MAATRVVCPSCKTQLNVPDGCEGRFVRCGQCKHRFQVPRKAAGAVDDLVASWLTEEQSEEESEQQQARSPDEQLIDESQLLAPGEDLEQAGVATDQKGAIRIVKLEHTRVLFEFPASRLLDASFRSAFPRRCLTCGSRAHLRAHLVIFAGQLTDKISLEAEHSAGALVLSDQELRGLSDQEMLKRLPHVPNVPHPADLPMPYWVCDMCSDTGIVSGQIQVNRSTGKGWCRLSVRSVRRALEFMETAGGEGAEGHAELKRLINDTEEKPWDLLPQVVKHRLQQWYKPKEKERFIAYIADRDHARTEDGMAGLVISNRRLIYHTPARHWEVGINESLELQYAMDGRKRKIHMKAPSWEVLHFTVDRDGLARMRRALTTAKFPAVWH